MSEPRPVSAVRRWLGRALWSTGGVFLLAGGLVAWLVFTASGARFVLESGLGLVGGQVEGVEGSLAGSLRIARLALPADRTRIEVDGLSLDWSPIHLYASRFRVDSLHARRVSVESDKSAEPAREPFTLAPPFAVLVEQGGIDLLRLATRGTDGATQIRDIAFKVAGDRTAWIVGQLDAGTPLGRASLKGTVGALRPFAVEAKGSLAGTRGGQVYRLAAEAKGPLRALEVALRGEEGTLKGGGAARIDAFGPSPLTRLSLDVEGADLATFIPGSPHTRLAAKADLAPKGGAFLEGAVRLSNADAGGIDKEKLPVTEARGLLTIGPGGVAAKDVVLGFPAGARATGEAVWNSGRLEAKLVVKGLDLLAWHSALKPTALAGEITARVEGGAQAFTVDLSDPRFRIAGNARIEKGVFAVEQARLERGDAFAQFAGTIAFAAPRAFAVSGQLEKLDPSAFAKVPAGEVNAIFSAEGTAVTPRRVALKLDLARSRYAGLPAEGRVDFRLEGDRLAKAESDLSVGATRLAATGAFGAPGDALAVKLASPDLAPLAKAFGLPLAGRLDVDANLAGTFAAPSGRGTVDGANLQLPGGWHVHAGKGRFALGAGEAGALEGELELRDVRRSGEKAALVTLAKATAKGTRASHEMRVEATHAEGESLRALLAGGFDAKAAALAWTGRLESFDVTGDLALALAAPARLALAPGRVEAESLQLAGDWGELALERARWGEGGFESKGQARGLHLRTVSRALGFAPLRASTLVVGAEWDFKAGETLDGRFAFRRERGDLRVGEPRQNLGIETLALAVEADAGRVRSTFEMRGKQAGDWKGGFGAQLRRSEAGWEIAPTASLEGRLDAIVNDLAWTAGWLGPDAQVGGRVEAHVTLAGTRMEHAWSGAIDAKDVAIREPASGFEAAEGTVSLAFDGRGARIRRFELAAPWRPNAEAAKAIAMEGKAPRGTLVAEGGIDLMERRGEVRVKLDAYPVTQLATRFAAVTGEGSALLDKDRLVLGGRFKADAGWVGIPATAPPSLSDDVVVVRGTAPASAREKGRVMMDLRVDLGERLYFTGRGLSTRLAGALHLTGDVGPALNAAGSIRAVGGTFDAYGRKLAIDRGALNFQGPIDNPGLNVLALRKGLPVEAGVEVLGTVARPKVRLVSFPEVPEPEKLAWLVLGRGQGQVSAGDATTLLAAANSLAGRDGLSPAKILGGLGIDDVSFAQDSGGVLGTLPQSSVAGRTGPASATEVVTVGKRLTDDIYVSYQQGLADAEGSLRVAWRLTQALQLILRAGYQPGVDAVYRFTLDDPPIRVQDALKK